MSAESLDSPPSGRHKGDAMLGDVNDVISGATISRDTLSGAPMSGDTIPGLDLDGLALNPGLGQPNGKPDDAATGRALTRMVREQLARDIADIEWATAALRRAQPTLQSWIKPQTPQQQPTPRPLWLLIGVLWLSTALITAGAVAAIASFAG